MYDRNEKRNTSRICHFTLNNLPIINTKEGKTRYADISFMENENQLIGLQQSTRTKIKSSPVIKILFCSFFIFKSSKVLAEGWIKNFSKVIHILRRLNIQYVLKLNIYINTEFENLVYRFLPTQE